MTWTRIFSGLRYGLLTVLLGVTTSAIVNGAILLAAYNLPKQVLAADSTNRVIESVMILSAALLATAPLIEWWYNHLSRWLNIPLGDEGGNREGTD